MGRVPALLLTAILLAGCGGGLHVEQPRVVPPGPGECLGRIEFTIVNGGLEAARVSGFGLLQNGARIDLTGDGRWHGATAQDFSTFDGWRESFEIAPGASRVVSKVLLRARREGAPAVQLQGRARAGSGEGTSVELLTPPLLADPGAWPIPEAMEPEALKRVLAQGRRLVVQVSSHALPGGGYFTLEVDQEGRAHGAADGELSGRPVAVDGCSYAGTLTPGQREGLRAAIAAAPFAAFRADPRSRRTDDGHVVRLLVACGPLVFVADSQMDDFRRSGLEPLLEHLRILARDLPPAGEAR